MKKVLISLLFASSLIACSTFNEETPPQQRTVVVVSGCDDIRDLVENNHQNIKKAFANNDANTIGKLELENRAIIKSNMECFPKMKERMAEWEKMNKDM